MINVQEAVRQTVVVAEQSNDAQSEGSGGANNAGVAAGAGALVSALALIMFI